MFVNNNLVFTSFRSVRRCRTDSFNRVKNRLLFAAFLLIDISVILFMSSCLTTVKKEVSFKIFRIGSGAIYLVDRTSNICHFSALMSGGGLSRIDCNDLRSIPTISKYLDSGEAE